MLADAAGTTAGRVAACENGTERPDGATVDAWAALLGCQGDQLRSATPEGPGEYWHAANQAMGPMSTQDLAVVADVILRSRATATQDDAHYP